MPNEPKDPKKGQPANSQQGKPPESKSSDSDKDDDASGEEGDGKSKKKKTAEKPEGWSDAHQSYFDSLAAGIRRSLSSEFDTRMQEAKEQADADAERVRQEAAGEHEKLYRAEQTAHTTTKQQLAAAKLENLRLTVAIEEELPDAATMAKRLVGDTEDEIRADAKALAKIVGKKDAAHRKEGEHPGTPKGAKTGTPEGKGKTKTDDDAEKETTAMRGNAAYQSM